MGAEFGLYYPPWNWTGKPDDLLERVAGEVGIDHVTVPVVTGEVTQFRLCGAFEQPYFHTEGGWHYPPQAGLYKASGVRPRQAKWFGTRDVLGRIRDRADKLGVKLILRIDLPLTPGVVEQAPGMRYQSAWGELPSFGPCVCNAEFRELVHATLADLTRCDPAGFELGSICLEPWRRPAWPLHRVTQLGETASMCFCAACRQVAAMAGVDPDRAVQSVQAHAEWLMGRSGEELAGPRPLDPDECLQAYKSARRESCLQWLERLANDHHTRRTFLLEGMPSVEGQRDLLCGPRWTLVGRMLRDALGMYLAAIRGQGRCAGKSCSRSSILGIAPCKGVQFPVWSREGPGSDGLVQLVNCAVSDGIEFFDFEYLDESPPGVVTWLKQAVRYARREGNS
jgi:hypothetical protein